MRDHGGGLPSPPAVPTSETAGIGLSVIRALAQSTDFSAAAGSGTEVRMVFETPQARALDPLGEDGFELPAGAESGPASAMEITVAPEPLAWKIVPRLLSALAARANFRTDRIADMKLVTDALTAHVPSSIRGSHLSIGISVEPRDLELRIAPLLAGRAEQLILDSPVGGLAPVIGTLTTSQRVATLGSTDDEMLALRLIDRR